MRTLSLSLFSFSSTVLLSICSFTRRRHTENHIYIWIALFYNGFDLCVVVVVASIFVKRRTSRARASLLVSLLFLRFCFEKERCSLVSRDLIWSSIRSSIDRRLYSLFIVVVVKNWERAVVGVCVWNLNQKTDFSPRGSSEKRHESKEKTTNRRRFYFKILWLLRRRNF